MVERGANVHLIMRETGAGGGRVAIIVLKFKIVTWEMMEDINAPTGPVVASARSMKSVLTILIQGRRNVFADITHLMALVLIGNAKIHAPLLIVATRELAILIQTRTMLQNAIVTGLENGQTARHVLTQNAQMETALFCMESLSASAHPVTLTGPSAVTLVMLFAVDHGACAGREAATVAMEQITIRNARHSAIAMGTAIVSPCPTTSFLDVSATTPDVPTRTATATGIHVTTTLVVQRAIV